MAHEEHVDLPHDLDALLRQAMSVEPGTDFLPRVRQRIAAAPRPAVSWWRFIFLAAPAAVAALVLVLWATPGPAPRVIPPAPGAASGPPADISDGAEPAAAVVQPAPKPRAVRSARARRSRASAAVAVVPPEPAVVVVVDERQQTALATLMRLAGEGRLTDDAFAPRPPQSTDAIRQQVIPVSVAPVEVSPIVVGGVLRMGVERN